MNKGNIYWIDKGTSDDIVNNYNLSIYNIKNDKIQKVKKVFNYIITDKVYGLGFYGDSINNVRLYEIWN